VRGNSSSMRVLSPSDADAAVAAMRDNPGALALAGGTDLMVSWNVGALNGRTVVDLSRIAAWRRIEMGPASVRIGALATHAEIQRHPALRRHFPLLVEACATVGAAQIQNRGTLGGNVANASPAGDSFPPLAVYEAKVLCVSGSGRRVLPLDEVFAGVKKTHLAAGELIEAIDLPLPARPPDRRFFRKVGSRLAQTISKAMGAGLLWLGPDGRVEDIRVAFGSVAPTVRRLRRAEALLRGQPLTPELAAEAVALLPEDVSPIDDIRSTRAYRLRVCGNVLRDFLLEDAR